MKIIFKFFITFFLILIIIIGYLSIFGYETDRFNEQITKKIKQIDENLEIKLKPIKIIFNPLELKFNIKTIGSSLIKQKKIIEIESIKTQIPLSSLFAEKLLLKKLEISSKSLEIKNFVSFMRTFNNNAELFVLEKIVKKGFLIIDINLDFDEKGKIKKNYKINGFVKNSSVDILNKYKIEKLNFVFNYEKNLLNLSDTSLSFNELNLLSKNLSLKKNKNEIEIKGIIEGNKLNLNDQNINLFIKPYLPNLKVDKLEFNFKNDLSFKIDKRYNFKDLTIDSEIEVGEFLFLNKKKLNNFFPKVKNDVKLSNHKIKLKYKKKNLIIDGVGNVLFQDSNDELKYFINKNDKIFDFRTSLNIKKNPFIISFLNFQKNLDNEMTIIFDGSIELDKKSKIDLISIKENNNKFSIKNIELDKKYKIINFEIAELDYLDKEDQLNKIKLTRKKDKYLLRGSFFNANNLIKNWINNDEKKFNSLYEDLNLDVKIDKLALDESSVINNLKGNLNIISNEIKGANLDGNFFNNEKFLLSIKSFDGEKITTLYTDNAQPFVKKYKFIKGFEGGKLDFYSSKKNGHSISKLKIYDFKLNELPTLTKILTLASLQGIADILSGEGIGFDEFEMNFSNKKNTMTIDEIYAIGPALSILMEGYVEKNRLISLRGTLVPATTINKFIGSIPVLGQILVGSKTGEGVFGVSFKIKGPPKKLETTVNPIKTLTPRFITRTLEKIKKN